MTSVLGERDASLLDLTLRHQLSTTEIAHELGIEFNNAHQLLFRLRNKLGDAVSNLLVWRGGNPRCAELQTMVSDLAFDSTTNRKVNKHAKKCEVCAAERAAAVDPQKLFGAIPIAIAPLALRAKTASALSAAGVPVQATVIPNQPLPSASTTSSPVTSPAPTTTNATLGPEAISDSDSDCKAQPSNRQRRVRQVVAFAAATVVAFAALSLLRDQALEEVETVAIRTSAPETSAPKQSTTSQSTTTTPSTTTIQPTTSKPEAEPVTPTAPPPTSQDTEETSPSTSSTSSPTPAEPPPIIERFSIGDPVGIVLTCIEPGQVGRRAVWLVREATSVQIITATETFSNEPGSDQLLCLAPGDEVRLEATGPGGTVSATAIS